MRSVGDNVEVPFVLDLEGMTDKVVPRYQWACNV